jgi:hypothetical protein
MAKKAKPENARAIEKAWKGSEHGKAARMMIADGPEAIDALVQVIPDDAKLIRQTVEETARHG